MTQAHSSTTNRGILMMLGFAAFGPVIDIFAKLAAAEIPIGQITLARFAIQVALLLPFVALAGRLHRPDRTEIGLHLFRGFIFVTGGLMFFGAVKYMPVADALAIFFVEPFILTFLGALMLGETIGWRRIVACGIGFLGAMLIIKPSFAEFGWVATLPLGTALGFAFYAVLTRQMSSRGDPVTIQAYTSIAGLLLIGPLTLAFAGTGNGIFDPVWPDTRFALYLLGVGIAGTVAHIFVNYAFVMAPAVVLAPFGYLEIVSGTILGWLVFRDFPDGLTFLGIAIIVGSGLFVLWRENVSASRPQPLPPGGPGAM